MASVLPLLLLLLLLLVLGLGGAPRPTVALNCSVDVVKEGQTKLISSKTARFQKTPIFGFMRPESDFEGVRLELQGRNGTRRTVWFPGSKECFPRNGMWLQLQTKIEPLTSEDFLLIFHTSACRKECLLQRTSRFLIISMAAAGPSSLYRSKDPPINCEWDLMPFSRHNKQSTRTPLSPCQDTASNTTTTTPATTTTTTSMKPTSTSTTTTTTTTSMEPSSTSTTTTTTTSREYSTTATTTTLLPLSVVMLVVFVLVFTVGYLAVFLVLVVRLRLHLGTLTNEVTFLRGRLQSTSSREQTPPLGRRAPLQARQGMESQAAQNFEEQTYDVFVL